MYFITISEMLGTSGEKIAKRVAQELNYAYYGDGELFKTADEMGFLSDVKKLDEKSPALFERFFSQRPNIYLDRLQSVIYEVAKKGDAIFFGKGSQLMLHSFDCAFHVLITGSTERRTQRVMEQEKVGREVAEKVIHRSDYDKRGFLRFAFDEDWLNPHLYDVILNTDKLSIDSAAKMIVDAAKSDEIKACGAESVKLLGNLSLQRKIEAVFLETSLSNSHLFFAVEDPNSIRLYGLVKSQDEKESIERIVKGVKGVNKVINELTVYTGSLGAS
jgi:cytidylate kinase